MCPASKEPFDERFPRQAEMIGDLRKDRCDSADAERFVSRDCDVMLAALRRRQPHVATGLPRLHVAQSRKRVGEVRAGEVPRKPHTAMRLSRTKWSRMTRGRSASTS